MVQPLLSLRRGTSLPEEYSPLIESVTRRGLRSGLAGVSGLSKSYASALAEALGYPGAAESLKTSAEEDFARAERATRGLRRRLTDVADLPSAVEFAQVSLGEGLGSTLPSIAGGLGARALLPTRAGAPFVGAAIPAVAAEAGETVVETRDQAPLEDVVKTATVRGLASGALEAVVPGLAVGRATGALARRPELSIIPRRAVEGAVGEFATEAAQDVTGQAAKASLVPGTEFDPAQTLEAGVKGALPGAVIGGGFALPEVALARAQALVRFTNPDQITPEQRMLPDDQLAAVLEAQDAERAGAAQQFVSSVLADPAAPQPLKNLLTQVPADDPQQVGEAVRRFFDTERLRSAYEGAAQFLRRFHEGLQGKTSRELTAIDFAVQDAIRPFVAPGTDERMVQRIASGLKFWIQRFERDGNVPYPAEFTRVFNGRATEALKAARAAIADLAGLEPTNPAFDAFVQEADTRATARTEQLRNVIKNSLTPAYRNTPDYMVDELTDTLVRQIRDPKTDIKRFDAALKEAFGERADYVRTRLQQLVEDVRDVTETRPVLEGEEAAAAAEETETEDAGADRPQETEVRAEELREETTALPPAFTDPLTDEEVEAMRLPKRFDKPDNKARITTPEGNFSAVGITRAMFARNRRLSEVGTAEFTETDEHFVRQVGRMFAEGLAALAQRTKIPENLPDDLEIYRFKKSENRPPITLGDVRAAEREAQREAVAAQGTGRVDSATLKEEYTADELKDMRDVAREYAGELRSLAREYKAAKTAEQRQRLAKQANETIGSIRRAFGNLLPEKTASYTAELEALARKIDEILTPTTGPDIIEEGEAPRRISAAAAALKNKYRPGELLGLREQALELISRARAIARRQDRAAEERLTKTAQAELGDALPPRGSLLDRLAGALQLIDDALEPEAARQRGGVAPDLPQTEREALVDPTGVPRSLQLGLRPGRFSDRARRRVVEELAKDPTRTLKASQRRVAEAMVKAATKGEPQYNQDELVAAYTTQVLGLYTEERGKALRDTLLALRRELDIPNADFTRLVELHKQFLDAVKAGKNIRNAVGAYLSAVSETHSRYRNKLSLERFVDLWEEFTARVAALATLVEDTAIHRAAEKRIRELVGDAIAVVGPGTDEQENVAGLHIVTPLGQEVITLVTTAHNTKEELGLTLHHEVMHLVLSRVYAVYGRDIYARLLQAANKQHIIDQVVAYTPRTEAEYFKSNLEELFVQSYALWAAGKLKLDAEPKLLAFFKQVKKAVLELLGILSDEQLLAEVFAATKRGEAVELLQYVKDLGEKYRALFIERVQLSYELSKDVHNVQGVIKELARGFDPAKHSANTYAALLEAGRKAYFELQTRKTLSDIEKSAFTILRWLFETGGSLLEDLLRQTRDFVDLTEQEQAQWIDKVRRLKIQFNLETQRGPEVDPHTKQEILDYVGRVLGPRVQVIWDKSGLFSGSFSVEDGIETIRLAVAALNPRSVAFHEAMHGLLERMRGTKGYEALVAAASSAPMRRQLERLLSGQEEARKQLSDPEEAVAYMYQFWAAGALEVGFRTQTWFQKITAFIRRALGVLSAEEKALRIMDAFHSGRFQERSAVTEVLADLNLESRLERAVELLKPVTDAFEKVFFTADARLRAINDPHIRELADLFYASDESEGKPLGFVQARVRKFQQFSNRLASILRNASKEDIRLALEALQARAEPPTDDAKRIKAGVRALLDDVYQYLREAGVKRLTEKDGKLVEEDVPFRKDYYPLVWNVEAIERDQAKFLAVLKKYTEDTRAAESIMRAILKYNMLGDHEGPHETDVHAGFTPAFGFAQRRVIDIITPENAAEFAPFLNRDLVETISTYLFQAVHRAEYTRRFGNRGEKIKELIGKAKLDAAQLKSVTASVQALEGTLGHDIDPGLRKAFSSVIVYQNLRLLPLIIFSAAVDPLGIMVRGGTLSDSFAAMKRGFKEIINSFRKDKWLDDATKLAEDVGVIDELNLMDSIGNLYANHYMSGWQRKVNNAFFRWNMMDGWTRGMRIAALQAGRGFLEKHAAGYNEHSERYLRELGLTKEDLVFDEAGHLMIRENEIRPYVKSDAEAKAKAEKVQDALHRWTDGAILRPNPATRPVWGSDPHWMLVFHLKQFTYSFQKTYIERVLRELEYGNYTPLFALTAYVPVMIVSDTLKGLLLNGGEEPEWKKNWGFNDYVWYGVQRAGLTGTGQFLIDANEDLNFSRTFGTSFLGPTAEQIATLIDNGVTPATLVKSLPANALYKELLI